MLPKFPPVVQKVLILAANSGHARAQGPQAEPREEGRELCGARQRGAAGLRSSPGSKLQGLLGAAGRLLCAAGPGTCWR